MSSSIAIPKRKQPIRNPAAVELLGAASSGANSYSYLNSSPTSASPSSPSSYRHRHYQSSSPPRDKSSKAVLPAESSPPSSPFGVGMGRRESLLGSSFSKSEYTVVNLGHSDGPPRLVTCVKSSQGFDWNQELFLPSYIDHDTQDLERKQDPVQDIILTDEEAASMLP